jgi:hypothetical protein
MPEKQITTALPLSGGIRRSRNSDPFFAAEGELTDAKNGTFTQEGGFLQHGGIEVVTDSAFTGNAIWMYRWYRGEGETNPLIALVYDADGGTTYLYDTIASPDSSEMVFTRSENWESGSGVDIGTLDNTTYFTTAEMNGYLVLCSNDTSGTDETYVVYVDGSTVKMYNIPPDTDGDDGLTPTAAPTETNPVGGSMAAGVYQIAYTYVFGVDGALGEGNPSPTLASSAVTANDTIDVTVTPNGRDDCTAIRIYMTLVDQASTTPFYFRLEVTNTAGPHVVDVPDTDLAFVNTEMRTDLDATPHELRSITAGHGRLFGVLDSPRNRIRISELFMPYVMPNQPGFFNDELNVESGPKITTMFTLGTNIYATSESGIWRLVGNDPASFIFDKVPAALGFTAERSIQEGEGITYGLGTRDIILFDGLRTNPLSRIRGLIADIDETNLELSISSYRDKRYYLGVRPGDETDYTRFIMIGAEPTPGRQEGFAASVFETTYQPDEADNSSTATFQVASSMASANHEGVRLFLGMTDGNIYRFDSGNSVSLDAEDKAGSQFELKTQWFFPAGAYAHTVFHKYYIAIENDGSGGEVEVSWEIMDDTPTSFKTGEATINLSADATGAVLDSPGIYNFSRYA